MTTTVRSYKDLLVRQRALAFAVDVYQVTRPFPREEIYGLTSQTRRAAVSLPSNIAEGHARGADPAFASRLDIALGSAAELETQLTSAREVGYLSAQEHERLYAELTEITRMIYGLLHKVRANR